MARLRRVLPRLSCTAALAIVALLGAPPAATQPPASRLTADEQGAIESACHFEKQIMGPEVYRQCVRNQLDDLARTPVRPDISFLNHDDRNSIEWICDYSKRLRGPGSYYRCLQAQLTALARTPARPDTSKLLPDEQDSIESACGYLQRFNGPGPYNRCVLNEVEDLARTTIRPDISSLPFREQIAVDAVCAYRKRFHGPAAYYRCLGNAMRSLAATGMAGSDAGGIETASLNPQSNTDLTELAQRNSAALNDTPGHRAAPPIGAMIEDASGSDASEPLRQFINRVSLEWRTRRAFWIWLLPPVLLLLIVLARIVGKPAALCARCGRRADSHSPFCRRCISILAEARRLHAARRAARKEYEACFAVLGIPSGANREQIRAAYRKLMLKYHPDRVAHLGSELQEAAKRRAQALNRAYHQLVR